MGRPYRRSIHLESSPKLWSLHLRVKCRMDFPAVYRASGLYKRRPRLLPKRYLPHLNRKDLLLINCWYG